MSDRSKIEAALSRMTFDTERNWNILNDMFESLSKKYNEKDFLFVLTCEKFDSDDCFLAIKTILDKGIACNIKGDFYYNFVQNALYAGYDEMFIINIMDEGFRHGLYVNHQDEDGDTMLHTAIYSDDYKDEVLNICSLMLSRGFDVSLKDNSGRTVVEAMQEEKVRIGKYTDKQIEEIRSMCGEVSVMSEDQEREFIDKLLLKMSGDYEKNAQLLFTQLATLGYDKARCLFALTNQKYDENLNSIAINSLLDSGECDPNRVDGYGYNFIQYALYAGYSERFIMDIIEESLVNLNLLDSNLRLDINHVDGEGDSILHTAIYSDDYKGNIASLFNFLNKFKFNFTIRDNRGKNIVEAMRHMNGKYSDKAIKKVQDLFVEKIESFNTNGSSIIDDMISKMTGNIEKDKDIILETAKNNSLQLWDLFYMLGVNCEENHNYYDCIRAILDLGIDPNYTALNGQSSFIQKVIEQGYSESFVFWFINENKMNINFNYVNYEKETILHSAIKSEKYKGSICALYEILIKNNFDSSVLDEDGRNIMEALLYEQGRSGKFSQSEILKFKKLYEEQVKAFGQEDEKVQRPIVDTSKRKTFADSEIKELEAFGTLLNVKKYRNKPTIGRDKEIKNLMVTLAQEKKNPILVGESGVGKTAIVDELAYMIQNDFVPKFLKDKIILEVSPGNLVAGSKYRGSFEEKMKELLKLCKKYDAVLFIDEIHTIYGVGEAEGNSNDMAAMLKQMIDRSGVKVIGTTTEKEYQMFFAQDALKRRFEKIVVKEPDEDMMYIILNKVLDDYCIRANLFFENDEIKEKIIDTLIYITEDKHRVYNDKVNNPDLAISIIDKAFAFAMMYECENINVDNFIDGIDCCDRIYDVSKESAKKLLKEPISKAGERKCIILPVDFTKFRR